MNSIRLYWATAGAGMRLIIINVVVFLLINIPLSIIFLLGNDQIESEVFKQVALPGNLYELLVKPWTLITHLFVHSGILHVLFNMLALYFSYQLFNRYLDDRRFINVYFVSGLSGAVIFIASVNLLPVFTENGGSGPLVGASAAVLGVMIAICAFRPNDQVSLFGVFTVKLIWIALTFVILDLLQIRAGNVGGHLAHLGGALFGFAWATAMRSGTDISSFFGIFQSLFKKGKKRQKKSPLKVVTGNRFSDSDWNMSRAERQRRVDEILDKINRSGYDSLTKEEKNLLFELSKDK